MSLVVTTTRAADEDIRNVVTYIAADNPVAAQRFATELWETLHRIADTPRLGRVVRGFGTALRVARVSSRFRRYLIFYRLPDERTLEIVRVLHGSRDITATLADLK